MWKLEMVAQWASYHHEKLDGAGYPFRISADAIPLGARILAVSDVFIALAEDRPYRSGYDKKDICLAELTRFLCFLSTNILFLTELVLCPP
ncbi:MAG: c-di-GMP phosphodiesterase [Candidatus Brocadiaceae bacterium]|nr:c-di-GMP phosphodiesterase [Candidatus Brocadiaceae bacterium]